MKSMTWLVVLAGSAVALALAACEIEVTSGENETGGTGGEATTGAGGTGAGENTGAGSAPSTENGGSGGGSATQTCDQCLREKCSSQYAACDASPNCLAEWECVQDNCLDIEDDDEYFACEDECAVGDFITGEYNNKLNCTTDNATLVACPVCQ